MKKFWSLILVALFALCLVACGETADNKDDKEEPTENVGEKTREYLAEVAVSYAEGDAQMSVTKDITLVVPAVEGVSVVWTSDNDAVKIEGNKGVVTRSTEEDIRVKIVAALTYKDFTLSKTFSIKVLADEPPVVTANEININGKAELEVGDEFVFSATVLPADAVDKAIVWSSTNENTVTVAQNGVVTATGEGTAFVVVTLASNSDVFAEFEVTVSKKINLSSLADAFNVTDGEPVKVRVIVAAYNAQGYLVCDETAYAQYYLGANAEIEYFEGDQLEIIGVLADYNGKKQFTKDATVTKIGSDYSVEFNGLTFDAETIVTYYSNVNIGDALLFDVTITSVSASYVNATIDNCPGYGICITYPVCPEDFVVGTQYRVYGYALYGKEYNSVKNIYVMAYDFGQIHTITFDTTFETTVEPIKFIDCADVTLPTVYREEYVFTGWMEGEEYVDEIVDNRDYNLIATFYKRDYDTVDLQTNGGELSFEKQIFIGNYNNCNGINKKYDCYTIYKKGSGTVAWASQYYLKLFFKEVEKGSNIYKVVYKGNESVVVTGDLLSGASVDYDYIISSNASNSEGHPFFIELYKEEDIMNYYWYFEVPQNCGNVCNIRVVWDLERAKVNLNTLKYESGDQLPSATRTNYDFLGWFDNAECTGEPIYQHVKGTTTYYAGWTPTKYAVTFELGEGTTTATLPTEFTVESENIILPTAEEMNKEGYEFLGWYANEAGSGTKYTKIANGTAGSFTLYAIWKSNIALEKQLTAADINVLNSINATKYVFADAQVCDYAFKGEGLASKYDDAVDVSCIFTSLGNALNSAVEGDVIYVFAGIYTDACTITINNLTIAGPNYGVKGTGERADEAELQGAFVVSNTNVTIDGLKFTESANIGIGSDNLTIKNCRITSAPHTTKGSGRKALIYTSINTMVSNINIIDNYICVTTGISGYTNEPLAFDYVKNLLVQGNYIANNATTTALANTEDMIFYTIAGYFNFIDNEFHMHCEFEVMRIATYSSTANVLLQDNKFYDIEANSSMGGKIHINSLTAASTVTIIGNEIHTTTANAIRLQGASAPVSIQFNKFYCPNYLTKNDSYKGTATCNCNWFENGVNSADTINAKRNALDTPEAVDAAYATYLGNN